MISVEFRGDSFDDLLDQIAHYSERMGRRIGHPLFIRTATFDDVIDLCDEYTSLTGKDSLGIVEEVTGTTFLREVPIGMFGKLIAKLRDAIDEYRAETFKPLGDHK